MEKPKEKRKNLKRYVGALGVLVTIVGWYVSNAEYYPSVYKVLTPKYVRAMSAFRKIHKMGYELNEGDSGFTEITQIIANHPTTKKNLDCKPEIKTLKIITYGSALQDTSEGHKSRNFITFEVISNNCKLFQVEVSGLKNRIEKEYREHPLFNWSKHIFWAGVIIMVISIAL